MEEARSGKSKVAEKDAQNANVNYPSLVVQLDFTNLVSDSHSSHEVENRAPQVNPKNEHYFACHPKNSKYAYKDY